MSTTNPHPEQQARDHIDALLTQTGWLIQNKSSINLAETKGIAVREYQTNVGPADYILLINKKPVGLTEAKHEEEGVRLTCQEDQSGDKAKATPSRLFMPYSHLINHG